MDVLRRALTTPRPWAWIALAGLASAQDRDAARTAPGILRTVEHGFLAAPGPDGVAMGPLASVRTETFDEEGRLQRWDVRGPEGEPRVSWVGVYRGDARHPAVAAYWLADRALPATELFVSSDDGRFQDVLYADPGEKQRREARRYLDPHGRGIYQEYFAPGAREPYSVEVFAYDDAGNEIGREWRRQDGSASRTTRFEVLEADRHGRWTLRLVHVDGQPATFDRRAIEVGSATVDVPPATAGPAPSSRAILPIPFAPGVIATREAGENGLTFAPDGTALFTRYDADWKAQVGLLSVLRDGVWQEPEPVPFAATMYNAAFSADGGHVLYCERDDELGGGRVFLTRRTDAGWSPPVDLTERDGLVGSYFRPLADGTTYLHRDGDLFRCVVGAAAVTQPAPLGEPVNTPDGTEFGAWVDPDERRLLFARAVEGAPDRTGLFYAERERAGDRWGEPRRLPLPYGWSPTISPDGEDLVYVVDDDVCRVPLALLDVDLR